MAQRSRREVAVRCDMCQAWRDKNGKKITASMEACPARALSMVEPDGTVILPPAPAAKTDAAPGAKPADAVDKDAPDTSAADKDATDASAAAKAGAPDAAKATPSAESLTEKPDAASEPIERKTASGTAKKPPAGEMADCMPEKPKKKTISVRKK